MSSLVASGEMADRIRQMNWCATSLGPIEAWPQSLRTVVGLMLSTSAPMFLFWGADLVCLYNDAFRPSLGADKHPQALGQPGRECWGEVWHIGGAEIEAVMREGTRSWHEDQLVPFHRSGYLEETFFTYGFSPVRDDSGAVGGVLTVGHETSARVLLERRQRALSELTSALSGAPDVATAIAGGCESLSRHRADVPFALAYALDEPAGEARLVATGGVELLSRDRPEVLALSDAAWPIASAAQTGVSQRVGGLSERLSAPVMDRWPEPIEEALVIPIPRADSACPKHVLVVGVSPAKRLDSAYELFLERAARQLGAAMGEARAVERERGGRLLLERVRLEAADAARESAARLKLALDAGALGTWMYEIGTDVPEVDERAREHHGLGARASFDELLARLHPDDRERLSREMAVATDPARGGLICTESRVRHRDGTERWLAITGRVVFEGEGSSRAATRAFGTSEDITERKRAEERLRFLLDLSTALSRVGAGAPEPGEPSREGVGPVPFLDGLFERLAALTGVDDYVQFTVSAAGAGFEAVASRGLTPEQRDWLCALPGSVCTQVTSECVPKVIRDVRRSSDPEANRLGEWGLTAFACFPLARAGAVVGTLAFGTRTGAVFTDETVDLLRTVAEHVAVATARTQAERQLRASEERYRAITEAFSNMTWRVDAETLTSTPARSSAEWAGLDAGSLEPGEWLTLVHPDEREAVAEASARGRALGEAYEIELRMRRRDGVYRWVLSRVAPVRAASGRIVEWVGTTTDVHDRKEAEEALRASEERLRLALAAGRMGTWDWHVDTRVLVCDARQRELLGIEPGGGCDEAFSAVLSEDRQRVQAAREQAARDGKPYRHELRVVRPDGSIRWLVCLGEPFVDRFGLVRRVAGVTFDVTERREAEQTLAEAARQKDAFIAMLGHELRNPLAPVRTAIEILNMPGASEATVERCHAIIDRQTAQMGRLLDDLLDVSRLARGKLALKRTRVGLAGILGTALETSRPLIDRQGHELVVDLPDERIEIDGDPSRLTQAVANLLNNAAKYTEPGGLITLAARREGGHAIIEVRDTGVGIPPELLQSIFAPFAQVESSKERAQGGLGLGLALVRQLVELHGGSVSAESPGPHCGSVFTIRLPVAPSRERAEGPPRPSDPDAAAPVEGRVLVVDDNDDAAETMELFLGGLGYEVRTAHDGVEAVETAERFHPAVVLMDIGMPRMDGFEACRRIREQPGGEDMLVVAVTGWDQAADRRRSAEAGFDAHLVKPVEASRLVRLLAEAPAAG